MYTLHKTVKEIIDRHPEAEKIFKKYGIKCFG